MFDCYDDDGDGECTIAYLLSRMKCVEATLPERLQIQSTTAVDPYLFVEISTLNIETLTLRVTSSIAFTPIMTSSCFTTPSSCCCSSTIRKGDVTKKPDDPNTNDCDWHVCMERQWETICEATQNYRIDR